jgi:N-acetylneuraminic acid mutarotase
MPYQTRIVAVFCVLLVAAFEAIAQCPPEWTNTLMMRRERAAVAFDSHRGRLIVHGGNRENISSGHPVTLGDTWEWNGSAWSELGTSGPDFRYGAASVYDPIRRKVVFFGGYRSNFSSGTYFADTWEYDGTSWLKRPVTGPSARYMHCMAFDPSRGTVVLFGGYNSFGFCGDTWEWNGASWTLVTSTGPAPRDSAAMCTDTANNRILLFGGRIAGNNYTNEFWELKASVWSPIAAAGPSGRNGHVFVYDPARSKALLFGGRGATTRLSDTWTFDGSSWTLETATGPVARRFAAGTYDSTTNEVLMVGGELQDTEPTATAEIWAWNGAWRLVNNATPADRGGASMTYDSDRNEFILFGGYAQATGFSRYYKDTWIYNGSQWRLAASAGPSARWLACMVYDSKRKRTVLFGGTGGGSSYTDTWEWNGATAAWTKKDVTPMAGGLGAMAFDKARGVTVYHGGEYNGTNPKTATYNGTSWTLRSTGTPPITSGSAMVYDSARQRSVLMGGSRSGGSTNYDTWEWDGSTWFLVSTNGPDRFHADAVYLPDIGKTLYMGGYDHEWDTPDDLWTWDGTNWESMKSPVGPLGRLYTTMAQGMSGDRVVFFGGSWKFGETYDFRWRAPVHVTAQPADVSICRGTSALLSVTATGTQPVTYTWMKGSQTLVDGPTPHGSSLSGCNTPTLAITQAQPADSGTYTCVVSNTCSQQASLAATVLVCGADFDCSGFVDTDDFTAFVLAFEAGTDDADFDGTGFVDTDDFTAFVLAFEAGC